MFDPTLISAVALTPPIHPLQSGDWLVDIIKEGIWWALQKLIRNVGAVLGAVFSALVRFVSEALDLILEPVLEIMLYVPAPETGGQVFAQPTNAPWTRVFGPLWSSMVPLGLVLLVVSYFAAELFSTIPVGDLGDARQREFGLFAGFLAIPLSRYVIGLYLQTMRSLTEILTPGQLISLSDLARSDPDAAAVAILLLAFLSASVYVAVLAVHVFRIVGIVMIAGAAPLLLGLYLGRFPILGDVAKSLLRTLPVLGFAPALLALGMRVMSAIFAADGSIAIDGLGVAGVVVQPLFLLAPGLVGIVLPVTLIRSVSDLAGPTAASARGKTSTPKTVSKVKETGKAKAKQGASKATNKARKAPSRVKTRLDRGGSSAAGGGGGSDDTPDDGDGSSGGGRTGPSGGSNDSDDDDGPPASGTEGADRSASAAGSHDGTSRPDDGGGTADDDETPSDFLRRRDPVSRMDASSGDSGETGSSSVGDRPHGTAATPTSPSGSRTGSVKQALSQQFGTSESSGDPGPGDSTTDQDTPS